MTNNDKTQSNNSSKSVPHEQLSSSPRQTDIAMSGKPRKFANEIQRQDVTIESLDHRYQRYLHLFDFNQERKERLGNQLAESIKKGKLHHKSEQNPPSELAMLDTCVEKAPTGQETGIYYAVDFGGTNLRCVRAELLGGGESRSDSICRDFQSIPARPDLKKGLMDKNATATELFDAIANLIHHMMEKHSDLNTKKLIPIGFTFSFPMAQIDIDSAEALGWTKGFETGSNTLDKVVGKGTDIVLLLNKALERKNVPGQVTAVLNDTTGTLISAGYKLPADKPTCLIGAIVGTGINVCYADPEAKASGYIGMLINTECGGLLSGLSRNIIDHEVDDADAIPGKQLLEKMVSGMYIPEICRRVILKVFQEDSPPLSWTHWSMTSEACMAMAYEIDHDGKGKGFPITKQVLMAQLKWPEDKLDLSVLEKCSTLCRAVMKRSATVFAVTLASLARFTGRLQPALGGLSVAIDGSVYVKNIEYQEDVAAALRDYLGEQLARLIHFEVASDGSGLGAAILASMPHRFKKNSFTPAVAS